MCCQLTSSILQEGEQLTIQNPLPEFEEILLSCARLLRRGDDQTAATSQVGFLSHALLKLPQSFLSYLKPLEASKLGEALIGEDDEGTSYVLDTVQHSDSRIIGISPKKTHPKVLAAGLADKP